MLKHFPYLNDECHELLGDTDTEVAAANTTDTTSGEETSGRGTPETGPAASPVTIQYRPRRMMIVLGNFPTAEQKDANETAHEAIRKHIGFTRTFGDIG